MNDAVKVPYRFTTGASGVIVILYFFYQCRVEQINALHHNEMTNFEAEIFMLKYGFSKEYMEDASLEDKSIALR